MEKIKNLALKSYPVFFNRLNMGIHSDGTLESLADLLRRRQHIGIALRRRVGGNRGHIREHASRIGLRLRGQTPRDALPQTAARASRGQA